MKSTVVIRATLVLSVLTLFTVGAQNAQTARWQKLLTNMMLSNVDAASTKSDGATARAGETQTGLGGLANMGNTAGMGGSSVMKLNLCGDKSFILEMIDSATMPGSAPVTSSSKITGSWAISAATQADAKVKLTPRKASDSETLKAAQIQNFTVSFTGARTFVNETRWYRLPSGLCKK
jgi:hypothetical protein